MVLFFSIRSHGVMEAHLTTDQEVGGSSPSVIGFFKIFIVYKGELVGRCNFLVLESCSSDYILPMIVMFSLHYFS
jgi:hypothetical protein